MTTTANNLMETCDPIYKGPETTWDHFFEGWQQN